MYGALAAFITAVYLSVVVGIGALIGRGSSFLTMIAAVLVAVSFQPVRDRVRRLANRLVYGNRATPYEVLSDFSGSMSGAYAEEDLLPRMARVVAEGTGAELAQVWLRLGDELRVGASWPPTPEVHRLRLTDGELPSIEGMHAAYPVRYEGDLLGALAVAKPRGEPLTPTEASLVADLASQAGLVMRNVRLTEELRARLEDLRASRQRLVSAQDEERRRLERNLHDGAQQQLVALQVKLNLLGQFARKDPDRTEELARQLVSETASALDDLRDLARGIYPPLLANRGLVAALEAQARKAPMPVEIEAGSVGRYSQEAEAAVYFCTLEALQNVAKYANSSRAVVRLRGRDGLLSFEVQDDGTGFDAASTRPGAGLTNMRDRLEALGGRLEIRAVTGTGTTVVGSVPARLREGKG
jgi:signal transduction histidine kinase